MDQEKNHRTLIFNANEFNFTNQINEDPNHETHIEEGHQSLETSQITSLDFTKTHIDNVDRYPIINGQDSSVVIHLPPMVHKNNKVTDQYSRDKDLELQGRQKNQKILSQLHQKYPSNHIDTYLTTINSSEIEPSRSEILKKITNLKQNELKEALKKSILIINKTSLRNMVIWSIVRRLSEILIFERLKFDNKLLKQIVELLPLRESLDLVDDFENLERDSQNEYSISLMEQTLVQFDIVAAYYDTNPKIDHFLRRIDVITNFEYVSLGNLLYATRYLAIINTVDNPYYRHMKDKLYSIITNLNADEIFNCLSGENLKKPIKALWGFFLSTDDKLLKIANELILRSTSGGDFRTRLSEIISRDLAGTVRSFFKHFKVCCQEKRLMNLRFFVIVKEVLIIFNSMEVFVPNSIFERDYFGIVDWVFKLIRFIFEEFANVSITPLELIHLEIDKVETSEIKYDDIQIFIVESTHLIINILNPISNENCANIQLHLIAMVKIMIKWFEERYRDIDLVSLSSLLRLINKLINLITSDIKFDISSIAVAKLVNKLVTNYHQKLIKLRDEKIQIFELEKNIRAKVFAETWNRKITDWNIKQNQLRQDKKKFENDLINEEMEIMSKSRAAYNIQKKYETFQLTENGEEKELPWKEYRDLYINKHKRYLQKKLDMIDSEKKTYEVALQQYNQWLLNKSILPQQEYRARVLQVLEKKSIGGSGDTLLKLLFKLSPDTVSKELKELVDIFVPGDRTDIRKISLPKCVTSADDVPLNISQSLNGKKRKKSASISSPFMVKRKRPNQTPEMTLPRYTVPEAKEKMIERLKTDELFDNELG